MKIPQQSKKNELLILTCVMLVVGLFFTLQKYENARFHKEISPKMFSQNIKLTSSERHHMAATRK